MEKTVAVNSDQDKVKISVITQQNKIVPDTDAGAPKDEQNLLLETEVQSLAQIQTETQTKVEVLNRSRKQARRFNAHIEHEPNSDADKAISFINNNNFSWKADTCKMTKNHPERADHCDRKEPAVVLAQVSDENQKKFGDNSEEFKAALEKVQSWGKQYNSAEEIPDSEIPLSYDFSNIDGYDFTGPIRDQAACGSCYTVSFTQVAESRLKMKYGKEINQISPQFLMQCNYLNEGCDGGWSFYHGYLLENGHMVSEECAPYQAKTKGIKCKDFAHCPPVARVHSSYFIGGAYGESTEKRMMKEMLKNGILNGELNVPQVFSFYQSGILSNDHEAKMPQYLEYSGVASEHKKEQQKIGLQENQSGNAISDRNLEDYGISWMNLNHSVVIIGWGVDPETGTKYWKVRNSYGPKWGMKGDFMVRRG